LSPRRLRSAAICPESRHRPLNDDDFATGHALEALDFRIPVRFGKLRMQAEAVAMPALWTEHVLSLAYSIERHELSRFIDGVYVASRHARN
jgi:hypothetical protein